MATYIIPIFCFGLVITGIVFLGVRQAADLAKQLAAESHERESATNRPPVVSSERGAASVKPLSSVRPS